MSVPIEAVSNGIDLSMFSPGPASEKLYFKYGIPRDRPVLLYVGRLDAEKHLHVLVEAIAKLLQKVDAHLVIVGHGNERERLENLTRGLDIENSVTFTGKITNEELPMIHKVGTVFCMPSPAELQSIATLEAMATGLPVVAVNAGALSELCQDGRNGYLYKLDDDAMMAKALEKILTDEKLRKKMASQSLAIAKEHDINHTLDRFEAIYTKLIKEKSSL